MQTMQDWLTLGGAAKKLSAWEDFTARRDHQNAVGGNKGAVEFLFFDSTIGAGRGRFTQTHVAVRGFNEAFEAMPFGLGIVTQRVDEWMLIYRAKEQLSIGEIQALVSSI